MMLLNLDSILPAPMRASPNDSRHLPLLMRRMKPPCFGILNPRRLLLLAGLGMAILNWGMALSRDFLALSRDFLALSRDILAPSRGMLASSRGMLESSRGMLASSRGMLASSRGMLEALREFVPSPNLILTGNNPRFASLNGAIIPTNYLIIK